MTDKEILVKGNVVIAMDTENKTSDLMNDILIL